MKEDGCLQLAMEELERIAPGAPLLALGQTVFWDEPLKGGVLRAVRKLGFDRRLIAGIHDTDYFAKLPRPAVAKGRFVAVGHNDGSTRGLWSAAGEFSTLFGSETVVRREALQAAGLRIGPLERMRPGFLDEATEAWGWRGIVALDDKVPLTRDLPLRAITPILDSTLDWAIDRSLEQLSEASAQPAREAIEALRTALCDRREPDQTLADYYEAIAPDLYAFPGGLPVDLETTRTSRLLRFNRQTCAEPQFDLLRLFVEPRTRAEAKLAYDDAIEGSQGLYPLERFGTGAIPFDLVIPGVGRGTLRLGPLGAVINTPEPSFLTFRRPLATLEELAEAIEAKFGLECALVGKAVTLIGMVSREHVLVFHDGASSYVKHSRRLHQLLRERLDWNAPLNPILRVAYEAWDALSVTCAWFRLPESLQGPFGTEELCAPSFAQRWREVAAEQERLLEQLGRLKRPVDLIEELDRRLGGSWNALAREFHDLRDRLKTLQRELEAIRKERHQLYEAIYQAKRAREAAEAAMGDQFRARIFEREASAEDLAERERLAAAVHAAIQHRDELEERQRELRRRQNALVQSPDIRRIHERRQAIELEAELKRLRLIRSAIHASRGLASANRRPSAWWFRILSPDGLWFRETIDRACYTLEPLD